MATGYSQDNKDVMSVNISQAGTAGAIIATTATARVRIPLGAPIIGQKSVRAT